MPALTVILVVAGALAATGLLTVIAWFLSTAYLNRVERRLNSRKGLYRELVADLAARDRTLLEPTIHQIKTLRDLDALEAVLEEQARTATGRPGWLLEVYDELGLVDKYIEKLRSARKWRDRAFAAELLGRVGGAKAVPALLETVQATRTEDADVREIALRALARIGDPLAVGPLIIALGTAESWLAPRIADILARHGELVIAPLMTVLRDSPHPTARAWAANVLGEVRAQAAFPTLIRGLDDPEDEVRAKSATALGRLGDRRAVSYLLDHMLSDPAPFVRARIAGTLGQFGGPEVIDRLVRALGDPAWWVRMRSIEALEQIGSPAEGPLIVALDDADPEIRARASVSLERLGVPENLVRMIEHGSRTDEASETLVKFATAGAGELLSELLRHPAPEVRKAVIMALARADRRELAGDLIQTASQDPEPSVRALAFETIRTMRVVDATSTALAALADPDDRVRSAAIHFLADRAGPEEIELLRDRSGDPEPSVRAAVARAFGTLGARNAEPDLLRLLDDPDPSVRETAINATVEAGFRVLLPKLMEKLGDPAEAVRRAAARGAASLGDRSSVPALLEAFNVATPEMREEIAVAVSRLDVSAMDRVIEAVTEPHDTRTKLAVLRALRHQRSPEALPALERLSEDSEPLVRAAALEVLGRGSRPGSDWHPAATRIARAALTDSDGAVRGTAIETWCRVSADTEGLDLLSFLQHDPSDRVRERAALMLGLVRQSGGYRELLACCRRAEPVNVRAAAALGASALDRESIAVLVGAMPDESEVRTVLRERLKADPGFRLLSRRLPPARQTELRALLAESTQGVRQSLARAPQRMLDPRERVRLIGGLRAFEGNESSSALIQMVRGDPSPEVRTAAIQALGDLLETDELIAVGARALGDPEIMVRRAAVAIFGKVPPGRAFETLLANIRTDDDPALFSGLAELAEDHFEDFAEMSEEDRLDARRALLVVRTAQYMHHARLGHLLSPLARSGSPEVREAVAELWSHRSDIAEPDSVEALTSDPVVSVRRMAARAATAAQRYDLLGRMLQDPDIEVRREVALALGGAAPVSQAGVALLERLSEDPEMTVRAAAYVARLLQGTPLPFPPELDARVAARAVHDAADIPTLRQTARTAKDEEKRLASGLALALLQDEVAREVAHTDPVPAIRHQVSGALELAIPSDSGRVS